MRRSYGHLVRVAYPLVDDWASAEDLAQEALTRAHSHWDTIRSPLAYLHSAIVNLAIDGYRAAGRKPRQVEWDHDDYLHYDPIDGRADSQLLRQALAGLPRQQRAVLTLRYLAGYSVRETAEALACSEGTVKSHTHRGTAALLAALQLLDPDTPGARDGSARP